MFDPITIIWFDVTTQGQWGQHRSTYIALRQGDSGTVLVMNKHLQSEIWTRLREGGSLTALGLPEKDGRVDLSGLMIPDPSVRDVLHTSLADIAVLEGVNELNGVEWS